MQIQTWHPPLWLCTHAKYYVKSGLTNVLKNANKTKNMHLFSIRIANYYGYHGTVCMSGFKPNQGLYLWFPVLLYNGGSGLSSMTAEKSVGWCMLRAHLGSIKGFIKLRLSEP